MKNLSGHFLAKLIASMPIEAIRKSSLQAAKYSRNQKKQLFPGREETLNRIFMVRYRIQHM
ncbi:MAG: hypothetical protein MUE58_04840 [Chitinophagaceae bacterium]|jgi:hypothetical protein|nr:hypothetical protein [Chitinophagaceae bacterium]